MSPIIPIAAFVAELIALFAIWNWRLRSRPVGWLIAGCATLLSLAALPILLPTAQPGNIYLGFAGMYLASALVWAWWADGLPPRRWQAGEIGVALLATALFAIATNP